MSNDFYKQSIIPCEGIIVKICRAYSDTQEDYEDYFQEVCLQIWKSKDNFRGQSAWSTWVYRLALNVCLTLIKKKKKAQHVSEIPITGDENESAFFSDESLNFLYAAIKKLSEIDRAIILLYLEEKSYKEIAEITGATANNIGVRINRIKERLKKLLDGKIN